MIRVLLTGASGLVGGAVARLADPTQVELFGTVRRFQGALVPGVRRLQRDLRDPGGVEALLEEVRPNLIINAAALSEPGDCVATPDAADALNVRLPEALARWAEGARARLVHLSTEQVFGGDAAPYAPGAAPAPKNLYGRLKAESEQRVLQRAPQRAVVVRAPLLLGNSPSGRRSVHERLLAEWAAGRTVRLYVDEVRQVAHADNLARVLWELALRSDIVGLTHWAGAEPVSRFELGRRIRHHFGLTETQAPILAVPRAEAGEAAHTRPADLRLDLAPLDGYLRTRPERLDEQLSQLVIPPDLRARYQALPRSESRSS